MADWCTENDLPLNVSKTKEMIVAFRKKETKTHAPVYICGAEVEQVNSLRFLEISSPRLLRWAATNLNGREFKNAGLKLFLKGFLKGVNSDFPS